MLMVGPKCRNPEYVDTGVSSKALLDNLTLHFHIIHYPTQTKIVNMEPQIVHTATQAFYHIPNWY